MFTMTIGSGDRERNIVVVKEGQRIVSVTDPDTGDEVDDLDAGDLADISMEIFHRAFSHLRD